MTHYRTHLQIRTRWSLRMHVRQQMAAEDRLRSLTWAQTLQVPLCLFGKTIQLLGCLQYLCLCLLLLRFSIKKLIKRYVYKLQLQCVTGSYSSKKTLNGTGQEKHSNYFSSLQAYLLSFSLILKSYTLKLTL